MSARWLPPTVVMPALILVGLATAIVWTNVDEGRAPARLSSASSFDTTARSTSLAGLDDTVTAMSARLAANPADAEAAATLADALMRLARVRADGGLIPRAEATLRTALDAHPSDYQLEQALASVYLAAHEFRRAIEVATRLTTARPLDPVNYGILGDARVELGEYDAAFDAFDRMMQLRPNAASYARVSYARELQGNLEGALQAMQLALDAVPGSDPESLAWHYAHVGELLLKLGRPDEASKAFMAASHAFPGHPFAVVGYARTLAVHGQRSEAMKILGDLAARGGVNPDVHLLLARLLEADGRVPEADAQYAAAEAAWRSDAREPRSLATLLASRGRAEEAVTIAEAAAAERHDIYTDDALAWAYFKAGRLADARRMSARALRTGSRDADILAHATAINAQTMARR